MHVVEGMQQDPAHAPLMATRAQVLLDWLRAQPEESRLNVLPSVE